MLSKAILALPLLGVVHARPLLHDRAYDQWIREYAARDDSTCVIVTVTADETVTATNNLAAATAVASATVTAAAAAASSTASASQIGDFGSCTVPQIEFGVGFDNRKETSYQPVDQTSYDHGSADNIDIITQFMCDTLVNSCGADALAQQTCASAKAAADTVTAQTGGQADAFNAVFGITTDFAAIAPVSDQGVTESVAAATSAAVATSNVAVAASSASADDCNENTVTVTAAATDAASATSAAASAAATSNVAVAAVSATASASATAAAASSTASASQIGDFGSCTVPQIEFGVGFDDRKETSYQPVDQTSYDHGSADNIDVITQFMCDQLVNTCGADALAQQTCASAAAAADTVTAKTGGQADAFNAVFGITTDFASVAPVSDTGVTESVDATTAVATAATAATAAAAASTTAAAAATTDAAAAATTDAAAAATTDAAATTTAAAAAATTSAAAAASATSSSSSAGDFGSCSVPEISFAQGLDGRTETAFVPTDLTSYNHGSADNIDVITQFICGQLASACGADATAQATCQTASAAADQQTAKTGAQADAFNAAFGITTDFASVPVVSDQGVTQVSAAARAFETGRFL